MFTRKASDQLHINSMLIRLIGSDCPVQRCLIDRKPFRPAKVGVSYAFCVIAAALFYSLCALSTVNANSLVANYDFEDYVSCPTHHSQIGRSGWITSNTATPDYFNGCSIDTWFAHTHIKVGVPQNCMGHEYSHASGDGYAGFITSGPETYLNGLNNYAEYVQSSILNGGLTAGVTYRVTFYVSLSEYSPEATSSIGAFLGPPIYRNDKQHHLVSPQIKNVGGIITETNGWTTITDTFVADGSETHITIGSFDAINNTNTIKVTPAEQVPPGAQNACGLADWAYYYVDDVIVVPETSERVAYTIVNHSPTGSPFGDLQNHLAAVNVDAIDNEGYCSHSISGLTADAGGSPERGIRGLAYGGGILWGIDRFGDLFTLNRATGETLYVTTMGFSFDWNGLSYDKTDNRLYSTSEGDALLGYFQLPNPVSGRNAGLVADANGGHLIQDTAFYPDTAPLATPVGNHPKVDVLYGVKTDSETILYPESNNFIEIAQTGNATTFADILANFGAALGEPEGIDYHPNTGVLYGVNNIFDDYFHPSKFSTFDFGTGTSSPHCDLRFEAGAFPGFGNGSLAFAPPTSVEMTYKNSTYCIIGNSTGAGWSWEMSINGGALTVNGDIPPGQIPAGGGTNLIATAFINSINAEAFAAGAVVSAYAINFPASCFQFVSAPNTTLAVGSYQQPIDCTATGNQSGCTFNPTLYDFAVLPVTEQVGFLGPVEWAITGTATGGSIEFEIEGEVISIVTTAGETNEDIAINIAAAINENSVLVGLGINAYSISDISFVDALVTNITITDSGLQLGLPAPLVSAAPIISIQLLALLAITIVFVAVGVMKRRMG